MQRIQSHALAWDDVKLFLALIRSKTLGAAARSLGIDGSTASRRLAELERAMSVTLFARSRDGITATKAAEDLVAAAEEIEQGVARFANTVDGLEREVSGLVRLTCPRDVAEVAVAPILPRILEAHPNLRIAIDPGETVLDLTRREADMALRVVRPARGDLVTTKLLTARWLAVASPTLVKGIGTLRKWRDVRWVGWGERYASIPAARWLAKNLGDVEPSVRSDSLTAQIAFVRAGAGAALVPEPSVAHYGLEPLVLGKKLRASAAEWPADDLHLITHRALREVPRVRVVWDAIVQHFRA